jgi:PPOX class probable F420-dependent enzyme
VLPTAEQRTTLQEEKIGVFATVRTRGAPQLTPVNYIYDGERITISVTRTRAKYHNVRRNPAVSLCVIRPEGRPYVTVYGTARIEEEDIVEGTARLMQLVYGRPPPENFEQVLRDAERVLRLLTPERFVS